VLHTFHGTYGALPIGQLVLDKTGNFYGTTGGGGLGKCQFGCGTAFKMNKSGTLVWTHSFDGRVPQVRAPVLGDNLGITALRCKTV